MSDYKMKEVRGNPIIWIPFFQKHSLSLNMKRIALLLLILSLTMIEIQTSFLYNVELVGKYSSHHNDDHYEFLLPY